MSKIRRSKSTVAPLTFVVRLTKSELLSFNSFCEERMMAFTEMTPKPKLREEQKEQLKAVIFNGLIASYLAGIQLKARNYKLQFMPVDGTAIVQIIKRRR